MYKLSSYYKRYVIIINVQVIKLLQALCHYYKCTSYQAITSALSILNVQVIKLLQALCHYYKCTSYQAITSALSLL